MSKIPESLRAILEAQKPKKTKEPTGTVTTIWRDGEIYKQEPGKPAKQLRSVPPIRENS